MAMIKCPKCDEEVSDKAEKCVHCGHKLIEEPKLFCVECGTEIKKNAKICGKCGCPVDKQENNEPQKVEVTKVNIGKGSSKKVIVIIIIISLLLIGSIIGGIAIKNHLDSKKEAELAREAEELSKKYKSNLSTITMKMLSGAVDAESCGNKIRAVWSNTIWEEDDPETDKFTKTNGKFNDDFNDSLSALFSDKDFIELTDRIEQNQKDVNKLMKEMKNPPEEWKDAYDDLKEYYDDYLTFTNLCINPSGSLQTFSTNFSNADTDALNSYNKVKAYLDY